MKKIGVFAHNLYTGGITSYLITISNYLSSRGFAVDLYYESGERVCLEKFSPKIKKYRIEKISKLRVLFGIMFSNYFFRFLKACLKKNKLEMTQIYSYVDVSLHKKTTKKYDFAISSEEFFCNEYVAYKVNSDQKYGWIHPDYSMLNAIREIDVKVFSELDKVVTVSQTNTTTIKELYPEYSNKFLCIENIIDDKQIISLSKEPINDVDFSYEGINLVTVCRLDNSSKRLDRIIATCVYLKNKKIPFQWYLVGDGKDRAIVEKWIDEAAIENCLHLLGNKTNPYPYFAWADCFVLTSIYEGMPISVEESKILHTPVIVTNYKSAHEQVDQKSGFIIENNDDKVPEQIATIIINHGETIKNWKSNFQYDNERIYKKINSLVKE